MPNKLYRLIELITINGGHISLPKSVHYDNNDLIVTDVFPTGKVLLSMGDRRFSGNLFKPELDELLTIILERVEKNEFL